MFKDYEVVVVKNNNEGVEIPAPSAYFPRAKNAEDAIAVVRKFIAPLGETIREVLSTKIIDIK